MTHDPDAGKQRRTCKRSFLVMTSFQLPWIMKFGERSKSKGIFSFCMGADILQSDKRVSERALLTLGRGRKGKQGSGAFQILRPCLVPSMLKGHTLLSFSQPQDVPVLN